MDIAITCNLKKQDDTKPPDYFSEFDSPATVSAIATAIEAQGHRVTTVDVEQENLLSYFKKKRVDMVFNIAEGKHGRFRESEVPAILDYLGISYTGSNTFSLALALNKALTKKILKAENIPTPSFQVFRTGEEKLNRDYKTD